MSTKGKEYKMAIRIAGIVDKSFTTSLTTTNAAINKTISAMDKNFIKMDKGFDRIVSTGQKCFSAVATAAGVASAAIGAATAAAISAGSEFETAFTSVRKTIDATEEEYGKLKQDILDMSREIPSGAAEIAEVMAIAGQLGIANENLTDFTRTMINLGVSTNLAAEDAATALAKFANITGMNPEDYERLGSVIVDLGNNFATTEADIVEMATKLASTGDLIGLSEAQIMALATAMSSVGIESEAGGSSMSKLLKKMQLAVETGSESLKDYASVAGMTGKQFSDVFREDAVVALSAFIDGLNDTERNGKSAIAILDDMGLTEVRLSNTIQALAGGAEVMSKAIVTANEAWEENTALAIEAGKRYETVESRLQIMQNAFRELGIVAYDELREPFVGTIDMITEKVYELTDYVGNAEGVSKWLKNIGTELPTLQRKFEKFAEPVFNSTVNVGKWVIKHGKGIISVIAGIGAALVAYKIASTLTHIVNAIMSLGSLNPITLTILGAVSAIGLLTTAIAAYKQYEQGLIDESLEAHFGNIALSMEEIQAVAEYIVGSDSLGGVRKALEAFGDLEGLSSTMESTISEIEKMNWKVSIGMELTTDEQESYKAAIEEYVSTAQEYALQSQYAVSLNLAIAFDEGDLEGNNVVDKVNQFYADKYNELSALGTQLNEAVTDAFNDGLLDIKETQVIAEIQAQMADIEESLATGEFDAQLSILGMEYLGGGKLTPETFQNVLEELGELVADATAAYKESYAKNYAAVTAAFKNGDLTEEEYMNAKTAIQEEYLQHISELQMKATNFQLETIMQQYAEELEPAIQEYEQNIQGALGKYTENGEEDWFERQGVLWNALISLVRASGTLDDTTKGAISQLLDTGAPTMENMDVILQQYEEMGKEIPAYILEGISSYNMLNALANNDYDSVAAIIGEQMVTGEYATFYHDMLEKLQEMDGYIPEEVAAGITSATVQLSAEEINAAAESVVGPAVDGVYAYSNEYMQEVFSQGFDVSADVNILLNPTLNGLGNMFSFSGVQIPVNQRADGGLATRPELTWFAENGPEMAIPIDGSQNAISLWEQTGQLLGMNSILDGISLDGGGSSSPVIEYSPTLQFYGDAPNRDDLEDALRVSQDEFDSMMERYFKTHGRVSFG